MNRSEVWWVNFDPSVGGETQKKRPAIILSTDASNRHLNRVQVVPITSKTDRVYPSEALITLNSNRRKAMADQIATVSKLRLLSKAGRISDADMTAVEHAVMIQLGLITSARPK